MTTPPPTTTVAWTSKVRLRDGSEGQYLGRCPITGKHRVFENHFRPGNVEGTTWLLDDSGHARGDHKPAAKDWASAA